MAVDVSVLVDMVTTKLGVAPYEVTEQEEDKGGDWVCDSCGATVEKVAVYGSCRYCLECDRIMRTGGMA